MKVLVIMCFPEHLITDLSTALGEMTCDLCFSLSCTLLHVYFSFRVMLELGVYNNNNNNNNNNNSLFNY